MCLMSCGSTGMTTPKASVDQHGDEDLGQRGAAAGRRGRIGDRAGELTRTEAGQQGGAV